MSENILNAEEILARSLDQLAKYCFLVKHVYWPQVFYIWYHLFIGGETMVCQFDMHLNCMNDYLLCFLKQHDGLWK
jgi:hypothetical protein